MLLTFICGWSASDRTRVAGAAASRDVRVILTAVTECARRKAGSFARSKKRVESTFERIDSGGQYVEWSISVKP